MCISGTISKQYYSNAQCELLVLVEASFELA